MRTSAAVSGSKWVANLYKPACAAAITKGSAVLTHNCYTHFTSAERLLVTFLPLQICCLPSETFCNGGCCASGSTCINRMCVPFGSEECGPSVVCNPSQFCGNSNTGLCCHRSDQIACGRDCCPSSQVCGDHDRCEDPSSEDSRCSPGQHWCAPAHVCCPYGWSCGCTSPWAG